MTTAQSTEGLLWRRSVREGCSGYRGTTSPPPLLLTQMSCEPLVYTVKVQRASAGARVTMRGLFRKRKADSWGRRLFRMGAVIWHAQAGRAASADGRGTERLQGDLYSTLRRAVAEQHVGGRRDHTSFRGLYTQLRHATQEHPHWLVRTLMVIMSQPTRRSRTPLIGTC